MFGFSATETAAVMAALLAGGFSLATVLLTARSARRGKSDDRAVSASDQEILVRAQFVQHLAGRVTELEGELRGAFDRERNLFARYQTDTEAIESRWRHLVNNLVAHLRIYRGKLRASGIDVPAFDWDEFTREGGTVREEWSEDD